MKKKGRGLSYDEKRDKMLKIFHDSKSVFNYEEIEKLSVKAGIPFPTVKEILNSLKADSLIECEKIGAGVFYWSFPSKAMQIFEVKIGSSQKQVQFYKSEINRVREQVQVCGVGRQLTEEREQLVAVQEELLQEEQELQKQISKYIRFDPERVELIRKENGELKKQVNAETDNLEQIRKYVKQHQPGTSDADLQQLYGIPADLDYLD